eukprot:4677737-Karenia_brevis.AAC.1
MDLKINILEARPRVIGPRLEAAPVVVFTDGACEDKTTIGAVLVLPTGRLEAFGAEISLEQVNEWKSKATQEQVIGQAELFPVLVAKLNWEKYLKGRRALFFLDNEAARLGL